jgi:hypothetical protein
MPDEFEARWSGRPEFAEVAEALELTTEHIIGVIVKDGVTVVLYSPELPPEGDDTSLRDAPDAWRALFTRGGDGVLQLARREPIPEFWSTLDDHVQKALDGDDA